MMNNFKTRRVLAYLMFQDDDMIDMHDKMHKNAKAREGNASATCVALLDANKTYLQAHMACLNMENFGKEHHVRFEGYAETVVPLYSPSDFKSHFRLERHTLKLLVQILGRNGLFEKEYSGGHEPVNNEKLVLIAIWYLANEESMRSISDRYI